MKVCLTLDVGDYDRYVIAKFFAPVETTAAGKSRLRATRSQVRRFAQSALATAVKMQAQDLPSRSRSTARRLEAGTARVHETLPPPSEEQRHLQCG